MVESKPLLEKDSWDRLDVVGKWLIPIAVVFATFWVDATLKEREAKQKTFEVVIGILQSPKSGDNEFLRTWALEEFTKVTGVADAKLPSGAIEEIQKGVQLPGTSSVVLPTSGPLRISIIRESGAPADQSEHIKSALVSSGYPNVDTAERSQPFPRNAEVRFYYAADGQAARSLSAYINAALHIPIEASDKSRDQDYYKHQPGDLHVYVR